MRECFLWPLFSCILRCCLSTGKHGPEKTPYSRIFYAVDAFFYLRGGGEWNEWEFTEKKQNHTSVYYLSNYQNGCVKLFNPFTPNAPVLCPLKTSENRMVSWCFQGVEKGCIGKEWVNISNEGKKRTSYITTSSNKNQQKTKNHIICHNLQNKCMQFKRILQ